MNSRSRPAGAESEEFMALWVVRVHVGVEQTPRWGRTNKDTNLGRSLKARAPRTEARTSSCPVAGDLGDSSGVVSRRTAAPGEAEMPVVSLTRSFRVLLSKTGCRS